MGTSGGSARARGLLLLGAVVVVAAACVGSVEREEFERIVRERGGGLSQDLVLDAVVALEDEQEVAALAARSVVATNDTVVLEVVSAEFPDEIDRWVYQGGDLDGPEPAQTIPDASAGGSGTFPLDDVALDQLDAMVDQAIEAAGLRGGYAESHTISSAGGEGIRIRVRVTNDREDVTVVFGPRGRLLEVQS